MKESYKTVLIGQRTEIKEKKSKFIGTIESIKSEDEAKSIILKIQKEFNGARHNCFAYTIGVENPLERYSDDGEPSGTAGMPILEVIRGSGLKNVIVVITRYFGGVLLGTGGLTRAYKASAKACIGSSLMIEKYNCEKLIVTVDYNYVGKIEYEMHRMDQVIYDVLYEGKVTYILLIDRSMVNNVENVLMEITNGQCELEKKGLFYISCVEDEYILEEY